MYHKNDAVQAETSVSACTAFLFRGGQKTETLQVLTRFYGNYDENNRLCTRYGMVEYLTTMRYIEKYLQPGMRILENGAATGRYSYCLARQGYANHMRETPADMDEATFELFLRYHFATCERLDLVGYSNHTLDIFRKD